MRSPIPFISRFDRLSHESDRLLVYSPQPNISERGFGRGHPVPKPIEPADFAPHAESFGFSAPFVDQLGGVRAVVGCIAIQQHRRVCSPRADLGTGAPRSVHSFPRHGRSIARLLPSD
jgi:hypothetical protein